MSVALILVGVAVAAAAGGKPARKPKRVAGEPPLGPFVPAVFQAAIEPGSGWWSFIGDFRPTPGEHGTVISKWCMPKVAGGGCRELPIELGYPETWIPATDAAFTVRDFDAPPFIEATVRARASKQNPEALTGESQYFGPVCSTWKFRGKVSSGPLPLVSKTSAPVSGGDAERCAFAVSQEPPRLVLVPEDDIFHLVIGLPAGSGSITQYSVGMAWR